MFHGGIKQYDFRIGLDIVLLSCRKQFYANALWPGDAIWRQRTGSTLTQVNGLLPDGQAMFGKYDQYSKNILILY